MQGRGGGICGAHVLDVPRTVLRRHRHQHLLHRWRHVPRRQHQQKDISYLLQYVTAILLLTVDNDSLLFSNTPVFSSLQIELIFFFLIMPSRFFSSRVPPESAGSRVRLRAGRPLPLAVDRPGQEAQHQPEGSPVARGLVDRWEMILDFDLDRIMLTE